MAMAQMGIWDERKPYAVMVTQKGSIYMTSNTVAFLTLKLYDIRGHIFKLCRW